MKKLIQSRLFICGTKFVIPIVVLLFSFSQSSKAQQSWMVMNANDSGIGSLRAQIDSAGIADTIRFAPVINGDSIKLSSGLITRRDDLVLIGNGEDSTIIDGSLNSASRLFLLADDMSNDTSLIEFRNMTFQHGSNPQVNSNSGGAMRIRINAKFTNCTFAYNKALSGSAGALECLFGDVLLNNCTFHNNISAGLGGAIIATFSSNIVSTNCLFFDNIGRDGGAMSVVVNSHAILINNTITNNHGTRVTGGVDITGLGSLELYNNIISGNTQGNGVNQDIRITNNSMLDAAHNNIAQVVFVAGGLSGFLIGYPDFVDTAANNFQLLDLSLGIDMADSTFLPVDSCDIDGDGNSLEIIDIDLAGNQRINRCALDIGAFENQSISFCPAINDLCDSATFIGCGDFVLDSTTIASAFDVPSLCGVTNSSSGLWYQIVGSGDSTIISTDDAATDFNTQIQIFKGSCDNLICVGGDDNSGTGSTSTFSFNTVADTVYYIYVGGAGMASGTFKLSIECIDLCPSARTISGTINSNVFYADSLIQSDAVILSPEQVLFQAGNEISLEPNFEVEMGAEFDGVIGDCP